MQDCHERFVADPTGLLSTLSALPATPREPAVIAAPLRVLPQLRGRRSAGKAAVVVLRAELFEQGDGLGER